MRCLGQNQSNGSIIVLLYYTIAYSVNMELGFVARLDRFWHCFSAYLDRFTLLLALDDNPARRKRFGSGRTVVRQEQIVKPGFSQDETMPRFLFVHCGSLARAPPHATMSPGIADQQAGRALE